MLLQILTAAKSPGISGGLSYESAEDVPNGSIVSVPLRNSTVEGMVIGSEKPEGDFDLKKIRAVLSQEPLLSAAHIRTMQWMAEYYCCSLRQAMRAFLPAPPWSALLPKKVSGYRRTGEQDASVRGKQQQLVLEYLTQHDWVSWDELRNELGVTKATMNTLVSKKMIQEALRSEERSAKCEMRSEISRPLLSEDQKKAKELISKSEKPSLLFGVTGSGKTEVYMDLIADMVEQGKQSILLVPEILLTEATIQRFTAQMDSEHIAVLHSRLTPAKRRDTWKKIRFGDVQLVIGSRSALFAPLMNLGLVIIDEEHEWTYKNEQTPRYHARETAEVLCRESGASLVLGSATPSIEAWHRAKQNVYSLARLPDRYGGATMPHVTVVDLAQVKFGTTYPFSNTLFDAITDRLRKNEQTVLFLNRRGIATSMICLECRRRIVSPDSNLPFTVHRKGSTLYLQDHTTGAVAEVPTLCPGCSSTNIRPIGAGTQRIEDILATQFPEARLLRADADTLTHPEQMRKLLETMQENRADILLGTQSVVKGLDLPNVTLAAVLIADVGLSLPHFRAGERVFQLLTQLTGRSGRAKPGEVIIQTFRPDAPEVKAAAFHTSEAFLDAELSLRMHTGYPPCTQMARLIARGPEARRITMEAVAALRTHAKQYTIGCAPTLFGGGNEWHVLVRGNDVHQLLKTVDLSEVIIDIDPMDTV